MAHADFLRTTLVADLGDATQRSLHFALSEQGPTRNDDPHSTVDQNGAVTNAWDWGIELCDAMGDEEGRVLAYLTMYVLPAEEDIYLVGHSLGPLLDSTARLMADDEYGDRACLLLEEHWPMTHHLLREGADGMPNELGLIRVRTDRDHWFLGSFLSSRTPGTVDVDPEAVEGLQKLTFAVLSETVGGLATLPGLMDLLPVDRRGDQLETATDLFEDLAEVLGRVGVVSG